MTQLTDADGSASQGTEETGDEKSEKSEKSEETALLPFYAVIDESTSMTQVIGVVNRLLIELHQALVRHPAVSDVVRLGVITFSDDAQVLVELSDLADHDTIPGASAHGSTNYGRAFALLRRTIATDVAALSADGFAVHRPAVFFLSDGCPTDPGIWEGEYAALVDPNSPLHPNVIAFGIGAATASVIGQVGTLAAYMQDQGTTPAAALSIWANTLLQSMLRTASGGGLMVPTQITGFHQVGVSRVA